MDVRIDRTSQEGMRLIDALLLRLTSLREQNDNVVLDATQSAILRGRIAEIKMLLSDGPAMQKPTEYWGGKR